MSSSQFQLLGQRRFAPFFAVQCLNAFNDNVFRQAIIGLLFWLQATPSQRTLYASLAPAIFILPYFLFSATAGQLAEKYEKARLIRITTVMGVAIAFAGGYVVYGAIKRLVGLRLDNEQEYYGADLSIHKITATPERETNW